MGMDGVFRPQQLLGYADSVGHRSAADKAKLDAQKRYNITDPDAVGQVTPDGKDKERDERKQHAHHEPTPEEELFKEELQDLIAKQFQIAFDPNRVYRMMYDEASDRIILIDSLTKDVLLNLTPEAFAHVMDNVRQNAGLITDRSA